MISSPSTSITMTIPKSPPSCSSFSFHPNRGTSSSPQAGTSSQPLMGTATSLPSGQYPSPYVNGNTATSALRQRYLNEYRKHHRQAVGSLVSIGLSNNKGVDTDNVDQHTEVDDNSQLDLSLDEEKDSELDPTSLNLSSSPTSISFRSGREALPVSQTPEPSVQSPSLPPPEFNLPKFFPPLLTSKEKSALRPLPLPIVIPQRIAGNITSPFQRVYAPTLSLAGIDKTTWLSFLDCFGSALEGNKAIQAIGVAGNFIDLNPTVLAAILGGAVAVAAERTAVTQSKARADAFLAHANEVLFSPRGLIAIIVSTKSKDEIIATSSFKLGARGQTESLDVLIDHDERDERRLSGNENEINENGDSHINWEGRRTSYATYSDTVATEPRSMSMLADLEGCEDHRPSGSRSRLGRAIDNAAQRQNDRALRREEKTEKKMERKLADATEKMTKEMEIAEATGKQDQIEKTQEKMNRRLSKMIQKNEQKLKEFEKERRLWLVVQNLKITNERESEEHSVEPVSPAAAPEANIPYSSYLFNSTDETLDISRSAAKG